MQIRNGTYINMHIWSLFNHRNFEDAEYCAVGSQYGNEHAGFRAELTQLSQLPLLFFHSQDNIFLFIALFFFYGDEQLGTGYGVLSILRISALSHWKSLWVSLGSQHPPVSSRENAKGTPYPIDMHLCPLLDAMPGQLQCLEDAAL